MHQTLINFGTGDQTANIELSVTDDREFSDEECFCAELVQPGLVYTFLHPYALTTMCIRDNEGRERETIIMCKLLITNIIIYFETSFMGELTSLKFSLLFPPILYQRPFNYLHFMYM